MRWAGRGEQSAALLTSEATDSCAFGFLWVTLGSRLVCTTVAPVGPMAQSRPFADVSRRSALSTRTGLGGRSPVR